MLIYNNQIKKEVSVTTNVSRVALYNPYPIIQGRSNSSTLYDPKVFGKKTKFKNPIINKCLAGLYSGVCPGLGQVVNGQSKKAFKYAAPTLLADLVGLIALRKKLVVPAVIAFIIATASRMFCVSDAVKNANNYADPQKAKSLDYIT